MSASRNNSETCGEPSPRRSAASPQSYRPSGPTRRVLAVHRVLELQAPARPRRSLSLRLRPGRVRPPAQPQQALDLCDDAKPLAYGSYALFGAAGALGVTSAILFLTSSGRGPEGTSKIALVPSLTAGGGSLFATGRF